MKIMTMTEHCGTDLVDEVFLNEDIFDLNEAGIITDYELSYLMANEGSEVMKYKCAA